MQREIDWSRLRQIEEDLQIARPNSRKIWSWWCSWRCTIGQCPRGATKEVCKKSNTYNTFAYRLVAVSRDIQIVLKCCLILLPPSLPSSAPPAFPFRISNWTFISASPGCTRAAHVLHMHCTRTWCMAPCYAKARDVLVCRVPASSILGCMFLWTAPSKMIKAGVWWMGRFLLFM